jgi:ribosome-binding factor A
MAGLDPAIPISLAQSCLVNRDARHKAGHDERKFRNEMAKHKHHRDNMPGGSQRALRVGELIRHALSDMLTRGDVHDPVLEGRLITVPEVRMSPDLRMATVYVMPLGGKDIEEVIEALDRNKRFLRGEIAHRVNLKFAPEIRFRADERFDEAERIEKLLRTPAVQRDLKREDGDE